MLEVTTFQPKAGALTGTLGDVLDYWQSLCGESAIPRWHGFDWMALPVSVIPWCTVVDVSHDPIDFRYRFWGTSRAKLQGADYTGERVMDGQPASAAEKAFGEYMAVVEAHCPLYIETSGTSPGSGRRLSYSFLRVPFGETSSRVDQILGVGLYDEEAIRELHDFFGTPVDLALVAP